MAKRNANYLYNGEVKKARLNISVSDHHLPLSQNSNKENDFGNWGDDNDDEMLLQASQACEQAISSDVSMLPDYSMWDPPASTSTQLQAPGPSKPFTFKMPSGHPPSAISLQLKNKCSTISSPLPGMANKFVPDTKGYANSNDDLVINTQTMAGEKDFTYTELLRAKEEKIKLMTDIDRLQQKCVTKEGEVSILRTQLKSCQMAMDSARMENARAQEEVKKEYQSKLEACERELANLQTQLEFKNLEIISVKEKCKNLESGKRMTQVLHPNHDMSGYRNNMGAVSYEGIQARRPHKSTSMQTEDSTPFVKLKKTCRKDVSNMSQVLPYIREPTQQQQSILDSSENLQEHSAFGGGHERAQAEALAHTVLEQLVLSFESGEVTQVNYDHLYGALFGALRETRSDLEELARRDTSAFLKDLDDGAVSRSLDAVLLLSGQELFKGEQGIRTRRLLALTALALEAEGAPGAEALRRLRRFERDSGAQLARAADEVVELIDHCHCASYYTGMLAALWGLLGTLALVDETYTRGRAARPQRAPPPALPALLRLARARPGACARHRHTECTWAVLAHQATAALHCAERARLERDARAMLADLAAIAPAVEGKDGCECSALLANALALALRVYAAMLESDARGALSRAAVARLSTRCSGAVRALLRCGGRASLSDGLLLAAGASLRRMRPSPDLENMLNELCNTFQMAVDEEPEQAAQEPWRNSFLTFANAQ